MGVTDACGDSLAACTANATLHLPLSDGQDVCGTAQVRAAPFQGVVRSAAHRCPGPSFPEPWALGADFRTVSGLGRWLSTCHTSMRT